MPPHHMATLCAPTLICLDQGWDLDEQMHEAQRITRWTDQRGVHPKDMVLAMRSLGYESEWSQFNTLPKIQEFLLEHKRHEVRVFVNYWDDIGECEGHWGKVAGFTAQGNPYGTNPTYPYVKKFVWKRAKFEMNWHDYVADTWEYVEGVAVFSYRKPKGKK